MEEATNWITPIISAIAGGGFSWALMRTKLRRERARLGVAQYQDVSALVERYINDLAEMSSRIENLHTELTEARRQLAELRRK